MCGGCERQHARAAATQPLHLLLHAPFRPAQYPEGFQTLLDRGKQNYRRVVINTERPALGKFKAELTGALKLDNEAAAASAISQAGYKQSTWWEDDKKNEDVSRDWRE